MPKLNEASSLYKETKRVADFIRGKRNLAADDTATIALRFVLREMSEGKLSADELLSDDMKKERQDMVSELRCLMTASKNFQNSYCAPSELLPKVEGTDKGEAEFA